MFQNFLVVSVEGNILGCAKIPDLIFGNIAQDSLREFTEYKTKMNHINYHYFKKCSGCTYKFFCMGCPAVTKSFSNDLFESDPQCWV
jgi:radical SAM protein with 4Fe4S-binding SPASM domain